MALVHEEAHHPSSRASTRNPQYYSRRRIVGDEGQDRLDAEPQPVCQNPEEIWPTRGGHVCLMADNSTQQVLQLETRPGSRSSECFCPGLGTPQRDRLCQPTMVADQQSSNTGTGSENLHHTVAPLWKSQPRYPKLLDMLIDFPRKIPMEGDVISAMAHNNTLAVNPQLAVWNISGIGSKINRFRKRAQSCSSHHGDRSLRSLTTHSFESGYAGVTKGILIPFRDL